MSHLCCVVLVPNERASDIESYIEQVLAPFNEDIMVSEYERPCWLCNGNTEECTACGNTRVEKSTYNPKSQWDWYRVGGRWDGWIQGEWRESGDNGFNFGPGHTEINNNSLRAPLLKVAAHKDENRVAFALVDLNGEWSDRGKKEDSCWHEEFVERLDKAGECWAVCVDCHI